MNEFEVGIDGKAPGADAENWWASPSGGRAPPSDSNVRQQNRCRRRMTCCIVLSLVVVCGVIAAIVVPTTLASRTNVASAVTDGSNTDDQETEERVCNGLASNCYRRVNEIMYPTLHNAMAALENQFIVGYNHLYSLEDALVMGFRGIMLDSCQCTGIGTQLCHSTCAIGFRSPVTVFENIVEFLNENENEIIFLEFQVGQGTFEDLYDKMLEAENFTDYMYNHPERTAPWPIINDLIANNTRLIVFQHDGPSCNANLCPPGFHDTYEFVMETPWNATGLEGLMRFNETCVRSRGRKASAFMLSNHFATNSLGLPEQDIAEEVNTAENIRNRTDACTEMLGRMTNFLAVDYWSIGDTLEVVQEYNEALPAITEAPSASPMPSTSPSGGAVTPTDPPPPAPTTPAPVTEEPTPVPVAVDKSSAPSSGVVDTLVPTGTASPTTEAPLTTIVPATTVPETPAPVATPASVSPAPFTPAPVTAAPVTTPAPVLDSGAESSPAPTAPTIFEASPFAPIVPTRLRE